MLTKEQLAQQILAVVDGRRLSSLQRSSRATSERRQLREHGIEPADERRRTGRVDEEAVASQRGRGHLRRLQPARQRRERPQRFAPAARQVLPEGVEVDQREEARLRLCATAADLGSASAGSMCR